MRHLEDKLIEADKFMNEKMINNIDNFLKSNYYNFGNTCSNTINKIYITDTYD